MLTKELKQTSTGVYYKLVKGEMVLMPWVMTYTTLKLEPGEVEVQYGDPRYVLPDPIPEDFDWRNPPTQTIAGEVEVVETFEEAFETMEAATEFLSNVSNCINSSTNSVIDFETLTVFDSLSSKTESGFIEAFEAFKLNQAVKYKVSEIKAATGRKIVAGYDADVLGRGNLHYTLDQTKQDYMKIKEAACKAGATEIMWRDESRCTHEVYTADQFLTLATLATTFIVNCTFRSDSLEKLINRLDTIEDVRAVNLDTEIPQDILDEEAAGVRVQLAEFGIAQ